MGDLWWGGGGLSMGEDETISKKGIFFFETEKTVSKEGSQNLWKSFLSFGGHLESSN